MNPMFLNVEGYMSFQGLISSYLEKYVEISMVYTDVNFLKRLDFTTYPCLTCQLIFRFLFLIVRSPAR